MCTREGVLENLFSTPASKVYVFVANVYLYVNKIHNHVYLMHEYFKERYIPRKR